MNNTHVLMCEIWILFYNAYPCIFKIQATELQTSMMETMEAVELEKQKHNETRREALAIMAKLEVKQSISETSVSEVLFVLMVLQVRLAIFL